MNMHPFGRKLSLKREQEEPITLVSTEQSLINDVQEARFSEYA